MSDVLRALHIQRVTKRKRERETERKTPCTLPLKKLRCHKRLKSAGGWGKMPSKLQSSGPPDEGRRITQVAGPTEVAVCEGVGITRIQPTPQSFRVDRGDVVALQARSNAWRTAQLKTAVRVHQQVLR